MQRHLVPGPFLGLHPRPTYLLLLYTPAGACLFIGLDLRSHGAVLVWDLGSPGIHGALLLPPNGLRTRHIFGLHIVFLLFFILMIFPSPWFRFFLLLCFIFVKGLFFCLIEFIYTYVAIHSFITAINITYYHITLPNNHLYKEHIKNPGRVFAH